jgi:hypothetical protein
MNKYILLPIIFLYLIVITLLTDSLFITTTGGVTDVINAPSLDGGVTNNISTILDFFKVFWRILTFRIDGVPFIITLIFFYPTTIMVVYMIVDIVKDLIPFT